MEYQARTRRVIILYVLAALAYLIFFLSMSLIQSFSGQYVSFIIGMFIIAMLLIAVIGVNENNYWIIGGSGLLILLLIIIFLIDSSDFLGGWSSFARIANVMQTGMLLSMTVYGIGVFIEWRRRRTQYRLTQVTFETQEAFYIEYLKGNQTVQLSFSKNFVKRHHLPYNKLKMPVKQYFIYVHEDDWAKVVCFTENVDAKTALSSKYRIRFPKMKSFSRVQIRGSFTLDDRHFCLAVDITEIEERDEALAHMHYERSLMLDNMQIGILEQQMILDGNGKIVDYRYLYVNKAFETITGWHHDDMLQKTMRQFAPHLEQERLPVYEQLLNSTHPIEFETLLMPQNRWFKLIVYPIDQGRFVTLYHDIDEIKRANLLLEYQASHDELTGLYNQLGLYQMLATKNNVMTAIAYFIDIRDFALINDYYGIAIGENVLKELAGVLKGIVASQHLVARFTSDQFVVMVLNPTSEEIRTLPTEFKKVLYYVMKLSTTTVHVKSTIGYAVFPEDAPNLSTLVSVASLAMQASTSNVHNEIMRYHPWMSDQLKTNINVANKLHQAIASNEIQVFFQEIVDAKAQKVVYLESLARWFDADDGWIPPEQFLIIAKEAHLIDALDRYLLTTAIANFSKIVQKPEYIDVELALNLAPTTLMRDGSANELFQLVTSYGIRPNRIHIEVSEDTFIHNLDQCNLAIQTYRHRGFNIAIDDFGSKYSSLSILESVDYDMIKIDGAFVKTLDSLQTQEIIQMVIRIAKITNKAVIIEKVENVEQKERLIELGCILQQGYLYHVPNTIL